MKKMLLTLAAALLLGTAACAHHHGPHGGPGGPGCPQHQNCGCKCRQGQPGESAKPCGCPKCGMGDQKAPCPNCPQAKPPAQQ